MLGLIWAFIDMGNASKCASPKYPLPLQHVQEACQRFCWFASSYIDRIAKKNQPATPWPKRYIIVPTKTLQLPPRYTYMCSNTPNLAPYPQQSRTYGPNLAANIQPFNFTLPAVSKARTGNSLRTALEQFSSSKSTTGVQQQNSVLCRGVLCNPLTPTRYSVACSRGRPNDVWRGIVLLLCVSSHSNLQEYT